ncbi:hypothetical protein [Marinomonas sp. 2405UD68-3]|uniref:hypothetical protein n=1 Tax=Marinomonas sp. 2405UD68-3 TaxID=3391835 RepID=UPI0039C90AC4
MNSGKKDDPNNTENSNLVDETKKTIIGAKNWVLDDAELMKNYWHHKMAYMEAWVDANWKTIMAQGRHAKDELDAIEDIGLLWLVDNINHNPVPLAECYISGTECEKGRYVCLSCEYEQELEDNAVLKVCPICQYGIFSGH